MPDERVTVWVQRFKDRQHLMLQWIDPDTGKRKSRSAGTGCGSTRGTLMAGNAGASGISF